MPEKRRSARHMASQKRRRLRSPQRRKMEMI
jgi:hypothetical protein